MKALSKMNIFRKTGVLLFFMGIFLLGGSGWCTEINTDPLPQGEIKHSLNFPHFPDKTAAFVFRNWNLVAIERIASVLQTDVANIAEMAQLMGLPTYKEPTWSMAQIYITILRRNWHLLPYQQLLELVGFSAEKLAFHLKEDDFLFIKLGSLKPICDPLVYEPLTDARREQLRQLASVIGAEIDWNHSQQIEEPRFDFIRELTETDPNWCLKPMASSRFNFRYVHSYFALFGDPLLEESDSLYPDGLLQKLADAGANGVWLHIVLRDLVPASELFPEFGDGYEKRISHLKELVERAENFGVKVYLYLNEPRAMPPSFFDNHPKFAGAVGWDRTTAICTSHPEVRQWLEDSLAWLFGEIPNLGGVFTITASENFTSCASYGATIQARCPVCCNRDAADIIAELNTTFAKGVHRGAPEAKVIVWDWGWNGHGLSPEIIEKLPENVWLMSVSEWGIPLNRGGVETTVGEYSISAVGPGPRATQQWQTAKNRQLQTVAKVQLNSTWEIASVPFIPAVDLVVQHCHQLAASGVEALMMGWSLGGYPALNLTIPSLFDRDPLPTVDEVLDELAVQVFGANAELGRKGWATVSAGFQEFPFSGAGVVYCAPHQIGPANLLYEEPTHYAATMVGIPYDALDQWRGEYPPEIFADQFEKAADQFLAGATLLTEAADGRSEAIVQARYARTIGVIYQSVANQVRFILLRRQLADANCSAEQKAIFQQEIRAILLSEIELAGSLFAISNEDSRIGFESTNQYWFVPCDLVEKILNCHYLLRQYETVY